MADEIAIDCSLRFFKSSYMNSPIGRALKNLLIDQSGENFVHQNASVATSATAMPLGSITTPGWCLCINLDDENYIELRAGSGGADVIRINAGEFALFRWAADATPYGIANTAAVIVEWILLEN